MRSRTSLVYVGAVHATLALVTLAMACGKPSSSGGSHCAALSVCCAASSFPAAEVPTCTSAVKTNNDGVCQSNLSAFNSLGYCASTAGNGGSGSGGSGSTSSGSSGSGNGGSGHGGSTNGSCGNGGSGIGGAGIGGSGIGGSGNGGSNSGGSGNGSNSSSGGSSSSGPIIQSLTANPTPVTPMGTTITAIVGDGVSAITGGTLTDKVSGTTYGVFSGKGAFAYSLTWAALYQADAITFHAGGSVQRVVTARFFDNNGHTTSQDLTLTLACGSAGESPCNDACYDFMTDAANCGACGTTCTSAVVCQQGGSACACRRGHCSDTVNSEMETGASCDAVCQKLSAQCVPNTCAGFPTCAHDLSGNNVARCDSSAPFHTCCCQ